MKQLKETAIRNLANLLTGSRIIATFLIYNRIGLLLSGKINIDGHAEIAILFLIVWISDIADGKVARMLGISSDFGAKFDVIADSIFVFAIHMLLASHHIVPIWFILLMIEKIVNYIASSHIISKKADGKFEFIRDPMGKVVGAAYFIAPCLLLAAHVIEESLLPIANATIALIALLGICSSVYRIMKTHQLIHNVASD